jgi:hypothetical protein
MRNVSDKWCKGKQNTYFILFSVTFPKNNFYGILWEKYSRVGQAADDNMIWRMRFACWISMATGTQNM